MGIEPNSKPTEVFDTRIKTVGPRAADVRKVLDWKMESDHRATYSDAIIAIILEYGESKLQI